jgi:hypothetical protein
LERRTLVRMLVGAGAAAGLGTLGVVGAMRLRSHDRAAASAAPPQQSPLIHVHKSPTCGCCKLWVEHLERAGFRVEVFEDDNLGPIKERLGVPYGKGSCHTGEVEGYLVEGHVPADDIKRLLAERPRARGLVLPAMPIGSPGMEIPDVPAEPFTVELVRLDGETEPYAHHAASVG